MSQKNSAVKNILLVRTDRIGDVVLTLPAAKILKENFPDCNITFLLKEYTRPLAENNSYIDSIITLQENNGRTLFGKNFGLIKNGKFDAAVVVYPTFKIALMLFLAKISLRIGTGYRWYSFLFNKKIYEHRKFGTKHELEHNTELLKLLGINNNINPANAVFDIRPSEKSRQYIKGLLKQKGIDTSKKTVVIHPGSGGSAVDLPLHKLKEISSALANELDINIFITGSKNEKNICKVLLVNKKTFDLSGEFNLDELTALIESSEMLIANSTGPIHIAAALGKYVIGFYPKIPSCSETRWGPYTVKKTVFSPSVCEGNCTREQCAKLNCMESINIQSVVSEIKKVLSCN